MARRYLERQAGLSFIAANVTYRGGELDLIMRDGQTWVFVEVRYRKNAHFGTAAETVTRQKRRRVLLAAALWLAKRNQSLATANCRFDIVAITGDHVEWLPGAFSGE